ncbi:MAG: hypothetical protein GY717_02995 [Rhodobacteraceae bacterium]|nr:hypothetical protein [Paracoccaceae bacterium]
MRASSAAAALTGAVDSLPFRVFTVLEEKAPTWVWVLLVKLTNSTVTIELREAGY